MAISTSLPARFTRTWAGVFDPDAQHWVSQNGIRIEWVNDRAVPIRETAVTTTTNSSSAAQTSTATPITSKPSITELINTAKKTKPKPSGPVWKISLLTGKLMDPSILVAANKKYNAFHQSRHLADQELNTGRNCSPPDLIYATRGEKLRWCRKNLKVYQFLTTRVRERRDQVRRTLRGLIKERGTRGWDEKIQEKRKLKGEGAKQKRGAEEIASSGRRRKRQRFGVKKEEDEDGDMMNWMSDEDTFNSSVETDEVGTVSFSMPPSNTKIDLRKICLHKIDHFRVCLPLLNADLQIHKEVLAAVFKMRQEVQNETLPDWNWRQGLKDQQLLDDERGELWMRRLRDVVDSCPSRDVWIDVFGDDGLGWGIEE